MTPDEHIAMRQAFEKNSVVGYKDIEYNMSTRKYICMFTQGRWIDWQNAWLAGQRYRAPKAGPVVVETGSRMVRVARTAR